jgi:hypothetical protein
MPHGGMVAQFRGAIMDLRAAIARSLPDVDDFAEEVEPRAPSTLVSAMREAVGYRLGALVGEVVGDVEEPEELENMRQRAAEGLRCRCEPGGVSEVEIYPLDSTG